MHNPIPSELRQAKETERAGNMPGSYSAPMNMERIGEILALQLHRVRNAIENTDWQKLPRLEGGFDLLAPYVAADDGIQIFIRKFQNVCRGFSLSTSVDTEGSSCSEE